MRIGVVGAGIAGVTAAHALRGAGFEVDLFEAAAEPRSTGYQLNVLPNGMHALSKLDLLEPLRASGVGATIRRAPIYDGLTGRVLRSWGFDHGANGPYEAMSFYRGDLHRVLLESVRGSAPRCGRELRGFTQEPSSGRVVVEFAQGEQDEFDLLVGADGARSGIRKALFPDRAGLIPQMSALLFAAEVDLGGTSQAERLFAEQVRCGEFAMYNAPGTAVIVSHAGGGRFGVILAILDQRSADGVTSPERAKALARHLVRDFRDPRVHHAIEIGFWEEGSPLVWRIGDIDPLASYERDVVALCGDAAHPMIPVVGQGANQSFEDAWRLAVHLQELPKAPSAQEIAHALARYSRERAPHVARVQTEARRRMMPFRFTSAFAYRIYRPLLRAMPQRILDRFDEHLLRYLREDGS